jgi:hypothetical protein
VTFVDAFEPGLKGRDMQAVSARFDRNIAGYGERATTLKLHSPIALTMLKNAEATFDLIYIDGSTSATTTSSTACCAGGFCGTTAS